MKDYFIIDIETCPLNLDDYEKKTEEEKTDMLNPIESRIVALGIRHKGQNKIFMDQDEKRMLEEFWAEWSNIKRGDSGIVVAGFNINYFDLPFLTARSLINGVTISPFILKEVVDIREKINAYRSGPTRGKLKEYAALLQIPTPSVDGSDVARLCKEKDYETLKNYLISDLEITEELFKRIIATNIIKIVRW